MSRRVNAAEIPFAYDRDGLLVKAGDLSLQRDPKNGLLKGTTLGQSRPPAVQRVRRAQALFAESAKGGHLPVQYERDPAGAHRQEDGTLDGKADVSL